MITLIAGLVFGIIIAFGFVTFSRSDERSPWVRGGTPSLRIDEWSVPARRALGEGRRLVAELSSELGQAAPDGLSDDALVRAIARIESLDTLLVAVIEHAPTVSDARVGAGLCIGAQRLTVALEHELWVRKVGDVTVGELPASTDLAASVDVVTSSLDDLEARLGRF